MRVAAPCGRSRCPKQKLICGRRAMKKIPLTRCALFLCLLAAFLLSGCQGVGLSGGPTPTPTPTATPATLQSVNHIIFMMQENRSFDAYFGKLNDYRASFPGGALGRDADDLETDFTNPADDKQNIRTFHLATTCIFNTTAAWLESHGDANRFQLDDGAPLLLDGFVHTAAGLAIFDGDADTEGVRSMGYYTSAELPSPYWFATEFATSDRWYTPAPVQTEDARRSVPAIGGRELGSLVHSGAGADRRRAPLRHG